MARYSAAAAAGKPGPGVINEFKALVRECHRRGIEVILDVVFNHSAEGNEHGPSLSFRRARARAPLPWKGCSASRAVLLPVLPLRGVHASVVSAMRCPLMQRVMVTAARPFPVQLQVAALMEVPG